MLFSSPPARTLAFHHSQILVDLHVDIILTNRLFGYDMSKRHRPWMRRQPLVNQADIPRMLEGGYTCAVLGIHFWPLECRWAFREVKKQLACMERLIERDERVVLAETAADIEGAYQQGKLAVMAGMEGAHLIGGQLDHLDEARRRGCLYLTLAHFCPNSAARPAMGRGADPSRGLTSFGRDLVRKLNELQMLVDVAHLNPRTLLEACELSRAPVIASHTIACGVHPHPRGVNDEGLRAIAATGGVVGIMFAPQFLAGRVDAPLARVIDHILYVVDLVGAPHVAIGSDFDGWIASIPNDIRDCRDMPRVSQALLDAGLSEESVSLILGGNVLRVLRELRS